MKSFLASLGVLALSLTTGIPTITTANNTTNVFQSEDSLTYYWRKDHQDQFLIPYLIITPKEQYKTVFWEKIDLEGSSGQKLKNINQLKDISTTFNNQWVTSIIIEDTFMTHTSFNNILNPNSLTDKISGDIGERNNEDLFNGAQFLFDKWNVKIDDEIFNAELRIGMSVFNDEYNFNHLSLAIWSSLWVESPPSRNGYMYVLPGSGIKVDYSY